MRPWVEKLCELIEKGSIVSNGIYEASFVRTGEFEISCSNFYTVTIKRFDVIDYITIYQDECDLIARTINKLKEKQEDELINFLTKIS